MRGMLGDWKVGSELSIPRSQNVRRVVGTDRLVEVDEFSVSLV